MSPLHVRAARETWVLAHGSPLEHFITALVVPALGRSVIVQRDAPASVLDGLVLSGLDAVFLRPSVDLVHGIAHCVRVEDLADAAEERADAAAAHVVSPTRYGAVADVRALADAAHAAGIPLIVDETWRSPLFGGHPKVLPDALAQGADLTVVRGPTPVLRLGDGPHAELLRPLIDRAVDLAGRASGEVPPAEQPPRSWDHVLDSLEAAVSIRAAVRKEGRFTLVDEGFADMDGVAAAEPLRIAINTRHGGISGHEALRGLAEAGHGVTVEAATETVVAVVLGTEVEPDAERFLAELHALPALHADLTEPLRLSLPEPGPGRLTVRETFFGSDRVVPSAAAVGMVSAATVTAYPPGVPVLLPGEVVTAESVAFLTTVARSAGGRIDGAADAGGQSLRVVEEFVDPW
ncbi:amino acid decarboxylase [Streptomyces sp. NPDC048370]|uniref:Orn/Lys/Arg family decarboxylase n=1 Tax=Streptomyces sp. NPDC048370 TaxID=3365540 RepID=UPI00371C61C7